MPADIVVDMVDAEYRLSVEDVEYRLFVEVGRSKSYGFEVFVRVVIDSFLCYLLFEEDKDQLEPDQSVVLCQTC